MKTAFLSVALLAALAVGGGAVTQAGAGGNTGPVCDGPPCCGECE